MKALRIVALVVAAVVATERAQAQSQTVTGSSAGGRNATGIAQDFESGWNAGSFFCKTGSPILTVWPLSGACAGRQVTTTFAVTTGGGATNVAHTFTYLVFCGPGNTVQHSVGFDGALELTPINGNVFTFNLAGGDTLQLSTTEGLQPTIGPALGRSALVAGAVAVSLAFVWLLRRRAAQ